MVDGLRSCQLRGLSVLLRENALLLIESGSVFNFGEGRPGQKISALSPTAALRPSFSESHI